MDNKIDILAITETWLKSDDDCYFTIRDICPQDYVFNHIPRTTGTGGGVGLLFKKNLKIKKLQTRIFRSFELMEVLLHTSSLTTRIVVVYRPPPSSINGLTSSLFFYGVFFISGIDGLFSREIANRWRLQFRC